MLKTDVSPTELLFSLRDSMDSWEFIDIMRLLKFNIEVIPEGMVDFVVDDIDVSDGILKLVGIWLDDPDLVEETKILDDMELLEITYLEERE